jgi:hypothetical protein
VSHKRTVLLGLLCGAFAVAAYSLAAAEDVADTASKEKADTVEVPEVIIKGHKEKLSQLEAEVIKAQDAFYDAFNQVNAVKEYETHCDMETPLDSHIVRRVCNPEFVHTATQDEAMAFLGTGLTPGGGGPRPTPAASIVISGKMPAYHKYVHDLVHQNPKLRNALGVYYALSQHYEAVRKEKFKGKWIVWD